MALVALCLGYFMVILDVTVVSVALPSIGSDLSVGVTGLQWVVDGYTLVFAMLLLPSGGAGDRLGGRRVLLTGLCVFTVASLGCAAAPSAGLLVAARLAQGVGAALQVPASRSLLRPAYPDRAARAGAFGTWGAVAGVAAGAGPVLGGLLVSGWGWRSVFVLNVPVGLVALVL
ncbi:MAG: transporter, partial [Pseudonocardia sp.]|nr:transporter [Pseudonocardia sp.]